MTKKLFIWVILVLVPMPIFAQPADIAWVMRYSGPGDAGGVAHALTIDNSANVSVTGSSPGSGANSDYAPLEHLQFLCRDANKAGVIDVGGVVYLMDYLSRNAPAPYPIEAGEVNCDAKTSVSDEVYLFFYLFKGE